MKRVILRQDDFSGGMNTRDNPKFLASNECQKLVNAYPGRQAQARQAIQCAHAADFGAQLDPTVYGDGAFSYVQQFIIVEYSRLPLCIARRGEDLIAFRVDPTAYNQDIFTQSTGTFTTTYTPNGVIFLPIGSSQILAIGRDLVEPVIIDYSTAFIEAADVGFPDVVKGIIVRPTNLDVTFPGGAPTVGVAPAFGTFPAFAENTWYRYLVTIVRRDNTVVDPQVFQGGSYASGLTESSVIASTTFFSGVGTNATLVTLTIPDHADIDADATHWRIYRTQGSIAGVGYTTTEFEALGAPLLWLADYPISGALADFAYYDSTYDDELTAEYQYNYDGIIGIPDETDYAFVAKGRLWVASKTSYPNSGRWFVSLPPPDATNVTKHLSMFDPAGAYSLDGGETTVAGWVDTSIDDADLARGGALVGDDVILWNRSSMWRVRSADPSNGVEAVSMLGCHAPRSITIVMDRVYWLSDQGPAMYQGGVVDKLEAFKMKEVWPRNYSSVDGVGEFFDGRDPDGISAAWHQDTWHITYNPLLRPVVSVTSNWPAEDLPTISATGTAYSAPFSNWPDPSSFIWVAYHEPSQQGIRGGMQFKPAATRILYSQEGPAGDQNALYDIIYPTPPSGSIDNDPLVPNSYKHPCGGWRELEDRINTPVAEFPEPGADDQALRSPWTEMMPQHFYVFNGELFFNTGANAQDGYSYYEWNNSPLTGADRPFLWSVWGGYLMRFPAKAQDTSWEGADEFPMTFIEAKLDSLGANTLRTLNYCYPMMEIKSRLMPCASKIYEYGEALDLRCGTWAHSNIEGASAIYPAGFTRVGLQYNNRSLLQVDWIFVPRLDEDNYPEESGPPSGSSQDGQSPYNGYNASGVSARDFFQHVIPEGYLAPYFAAEVVIPAVPWDNNVPSSVDWLEIGYIPRKNWGPTLVSLSDNQAVE